MTTKVSWLSWARARLQETWKKQPSLQRRSGLAVIRERPSGNHVAREDLSGETLYGFRFRKCLFTKNELRPQVFSIASFGVRFLNTWCLPINYRGIPRSYRVNSLGYMQKTCISSAAHRSSRDVSSALEENMNSVLLKSAGAWVLALALTSGVFAAQINGSIEIIGQGNLDSSTLVNANSVAATTGTVFLADNDFAPLLGASANYSAFTWDPVTVPVMPLWSIVAPLAASFDLLTMVVENQDSNHLDLSGTGVLHLQGFDDTYGLWSYAITDSDGTGTGPDNVKFGFLSSNSAVPQVPDGGTTALLFGCSFVFLSLINRHRKSA